MKWYKDKYRLKLETLALDRFDNFKFVKKGSNLDVKGKIHTRFGKDYNIKIVFPDNYPNAAPDVYCIDHLKKCPHTYEGGKLCYHYNEWRANFTIAVAIGWAADWFDKYDYWEQYGDWKGKEY